MSASVPSSSATTPAPKSIPDDIEEIVIGLGNIWTDDDLQLTATDHCAKRILGLLDCFKVYCLKILRRRSSGGLRNA